MKRVWVEFVWRLLTDDQRERRQTIGGDLLERSCEDVQFVKNIVTGDESWVYGYDRETKQHSAQWKGPSSPRPKKGRDSPCRAGSQKDTKVITALAKAK